MPEAAEVLCAGAADHSSADDGEVVRHFLVNIFEFLSFYLVIVFKGVKVSICF